MNLGIICDVNSNNPIGVIGVEKETGNVGYITNNNDLDKIIDVILDNEQLEIQIREIINKCEIMRYEKINSINSNYLMAFNYYLPYPWRILGIKQIDGDIEKVLNESFNYMEELI